MMYPITWTLIEVRMGIDLFLILKLQKTIPMAHTAAHK
jgi:hypothetical protein